MGKYVTAFVLSVTLLTSCNGISGEEEYRCGLDLAGDLDPGEELSLPETFIRKNCVTSCRISYHTPLTIRIGRGDNVYQSHYIDITEDSLTVYKYASGYYPIQKMSLDLPLNGNLSITLSAGESDSCKLTLSSAGKEVAYKLAWWGGGKPFVRNMSDATISATLAFESTDYGQPVWIIGDSYVNWLYLGRWPYYIYRQGYRDWMADHLPGGNSERLLQCFINDLEYTDLRPKFAVWTLGMNDSSDKDDSTPDDKWMSCVSTFLQLCRVNGITPILATIPSVPGRRHYAKTIRVRDSGIRFIDFAAAVDPDDDGIWLSGMLYEDGVHPSATGAEALARRAIEDFPEIMGK